MAFYGKVGDVNNSISSASAYPGGRSYGMTPPSATRYRVRNNSAGELAAVNQGNGGVGRARRSAPAMQDSNGITGKPIGWWLTILVIFIGVIWLMKKFAPGEGREFGNINPGLYNGFFLTLYIVLILSVLKVAAAKFGRIPGLGALADLILAI